MATAVHNHSKLVEVIATKNKKALVEAFDALSTKEKIDLLVYVGAKTPNELFLKLRNYVENFLAQ